MKKGKVWLWVKVHIMSPARFFFDRVFNSAGFISNLEINDGKSGIKVRSKKKRLWLTGNTLSPPKGGRTLIHVEGKE